MPEEFYAAIQFAEDETRQGPGRLTGTLVTYGEKAGDRDVVFAEDSLHWPEAGVVLNEQHNRQAPIVRFTPFQDGKAVKIDVPLPDTQRGRDIATSVKNGTLTGLSIEIEPERSNQLADFLEHQRARLVAAAVVDSPAFRGSGVQVHAKNPGKRPPGARTVML